MRQGGNPTLASAKAAGNQSLTLQATCLVVSEPFAPAQRGV